MIHSESPMVQFKAIHSFSSCAGPEPTLFGKPKFCCMRLHYRNEETSGYFHTLRAATRMPEDDGKGLSFIFIKPWKSCLLALHVLEQNTVTYFRHAAVHC